MKVSNPILYIESPVFIGVENLLHKEDIASSKFLEIAW